MDFSIIILPDGRKQISMELSSGSFLKVRDFYSSLGLHCFSSVQSLSHVWLFVTPWIAARQASLGRPEVKWSEVKWNELAQSCPTLCDPMDCSLPGSSLHGILQARVLEWVAIAFSRGSSWPRDWTQVSRIPGRGFNLWATREAPKVDYWLENPQSSVTSFIGSSFSTSYLISFNCRSFLKD